MVRTMVLWNAYCNADQALQRLNRFHAFYLEAEYIKPGDAWDSALLEVETYLERELNQLDLILSDRDLHWSETGGDTSIEVSPGGDCDDCE